VAEQSKHINKTARGAYEKYEGILVSQKKRSPAPKVEIAWSNPLGESQSTHSSRNGCVLLLKNGGRQGRSAVRGERENGIEAG